jgi:hypothetical protein
VDVSDDGDKAGGSVDGEVGTVNGGDIRGVQHTGCWKHTVGVCDDEDKTGESDDGESGTMGGGDIRGVQISDC